MARIKEYSNDDITIVWQAEKCIHSERCWRGLQEVFDPKARPWIKPEGATTAAIRAQVDQCPSGALTWYNKAAGPPAPDHGQTTRVVVMKDGPLLLHGNIEVEQPDGSTSNHQQVTAMCRCGQSGNKPWCDGSHAHVQHKD